jgi:4-hydroxy-3-methylbut-2-enyl diphosphate reductase
VVRKLGGKPAHLVDGVEDVDPAWFEGVERVGVTSGASTPSQLTRRVIEHLEALGDALAAAQAAEHAGQTTG